MTQTTREGTHSFQIVRTVKASAEEAYAAWTDPVLMRRWFGTVVEADVRVGGQYRVENHEADGQIYKHKGEYRVLEPGRRIVMTFTFDGDQSGYAGLYSDEIITIQFRSLAPQLTEVTLINSWNGKGMNDEEKQRLDEGWGDWFDRYERALRD